MKLKNEKLIINEEKLYFIMYAIHVIAEKYNISPQKVYRTLNNTNIFEEYFVECFDVAHSMGKNAIINDVEEYLNNRGIKIC